MYHDQIFRSIQSFIEAFNNGTLIRRPEQADPKADYSWPERQRKKHDRDLDYLPGPRSVSFAGLRYKVDRERQYISWLGWGLYLGFNRDMGLNLWDIRFRGERLVYEVVVTSSFLSMFDRTTIWISLLLKRPWRNTVNRRLMTLILLFLLSSFVTNTAGNDPAQGSTAWLDRYFGMGAFTKDLMPQYDCPVESVYLPATTYTILGNIQRRRAICIFEQDVGKPLSRQDRKSVV